MLAGKVAEEVRMRTLNMWSKLLTAQAAIAKNILFSLKTFVFSPCKWAEEKRAKHQKVTNSHSTVVVAEAKTEENIKCA